MNKMNIKNNPKVTMSACFIGYIVQAIVNNFLPLLFVTFQNDYVISLLEISLLITINFIIQLLIDLFSAYFIDKIGYRVSILLAHFFAMLGLIMLTFLPDLLTNHYLGILLSIIVYAIGGGLIEVLISPIMESCPSKNKEKAMSLLHSFYCWGHMGVVLLSTLFFFIFSINNWRILALLWAIVPLLNIVLFSFAPLYPITENNEKGATITDLLKTPVFYALMIMMLCAGASEQAVSQWASTFVEIGLNVSKTIGDLSGPMCFAFLMGTSRLIYGKFGDKINLNMFMKLSAILCIISYLVISLSPLPIISLIFCAICGFSVGIMWPGTFSNATKLISNGGTLLFAMLALAGDIGCSLGPTITGLFSNLFDNDLRIGILFSIIFPIVMCIMLFFFIKKPKLTNSIKGTL